MRKGFSRLRYAEYMLSDEWRSKKVDFFRKLTSEGRYSCASCGRNPYQLKESGDYLTVHHLTYARFGDESMEDLQLLCSVCHRRLTKEERKRRKARRQSRLDRAWKRKKRLG
jgi:5-methylcytosine-specific restriction endonuclease McrA